MTGDPVAVPLTVTHHALGDCVTTVLSIPSAVISVTVATDIDHTGKHDLMAVLAKMAPLMLRLWDEAVTGEDVAVLDMRGDVP